ncbi:DUF262 domain-containing protein [Actinomycetospora sp. C-140]
MYVERTELELELLVARIDRRELDHRPDRPPFRSWGRAHQQRLIDSILRNWSVPAVHVAGAPPGAPEVVLDGHERLITIARFFHDDLACDGGTTPTHGEVARLHGLRFSDLPEEVRCRVRRFRLPVVTVFDYEAGELTELLARIHQPIRSRPWIPTPRIGDAPPGGPRTEGVHRASGSLEPIYDQVSAWFADLSEFGREPTRWTSPADPGDAAARAAVDPQGLDTTDAGLPQREPRAHLVPGAIDPPTVAIDRDALPDARDVAERLTTYRDGVLDARWERDGAG